MLSLSGNTRLILAIGSRYVMHDTRNEDAPNIIFFMVINYFEIVSQYKDSVDAIHLLYISVAGKTRTMQVIYMYMNLFVRFCESGLCEPLLSNWK